ncbi:MAG: 2Fe-2S iron-sulfur cluster binding domain-containing protein [Thauera phenolivorans]|uniref:2Fe-2S iron-sulfur cluster binding domain-containing protein n=1 Tax=Thauera phenolivorans TaxID=1792543 RepID=A0A7X7LV76_9RHOO|nr:2Fe-2S iron-sulfur cluster-binding protein [Thauera phenolivorans]NLF54002.1 2Fe-2S iron-sulfur cluster binding domain-containing protein [Thauera phenolivorans]
MDKRFSVLIENTGERFNCGSNQNLLRGMEVLGRRGIPVGCRGGGCGVCKVHILSGEYHTQRMSRSCLSVEEEAEGIVLACKAFPDSDVTLRVIGKMCKAVNNVAA